MNSNFQFRVRKLYAKPVMGVDPNSILSYDKSPYLRNKVEIIQWKKRLTIDLWLIVVRFSWNTKKKKQTFKWNKAAYDLPSKEEDEELSRRLKPISKRPKPNFPRSIFK